MEVILKHKFYSLLLLSFVLCASASFTTKADAAETKTVVAEETTSVESTTQAVTSTVITTKTKVKVNKTFKINKKLNIKKSKLKKYTITTSNAKVASVSDTGVVTGLKKGSASKKDNSTYAKITVKVKNRYTKSSLRLMSSIIYSEAGGECYAGKKAVGIVIMNRINSSQFPNTLSGVIYQSGQFSPTRNGSLNKSLALYDNGSMNKDCIKAAKATLNGDTYVYYNNQTINMNSYLFFSGYLSNSRLKIQGHCFK
jgi:spore germination cell wall hydrolase CwlJ-like protein